MVIEAVLFDLDGTLIDTTDIMHLRDERKWRECAQSAHRTLLYPGVQELLRELENRGIQWAVVTNVVSNYANALLRHHDLKNEKIIAYHDVQQHKPHPEGCLKALQQLGVSPAAALGVGDLASDRDAFLSAGLPAFCAGWNSQSDLTGPWFAILRYPRDLVTFL